MWNKIGVFLKKRNKEVHSLAIGGKRYYTQKTNLQSHTTEDENYKERSASAWCGRPSLHAKEDGERKWTRTFHDVKGMWWGVEVDLGRCLVRTLAIDADGHCSSRARSDGGRQPQTAPANTSITASGARSMSQMLCVVGRRRGRGCVNLRTATSTSRAKFVENFPLL